MRVFIIPVLLLSLSLLSNNALAYDEVPGDNQPSTSTPSSDPWEGYSSDPYGEFGVGNDGQAFDGTKGHSIGVDPDTGQLSGGGGNSGGANNSHGSGFPGPSGDGGGSGNQGDGSQAGNKTTYDSPDPDEVNTDKKTTMEKLYSTVSAIAQKTVLGKAVSAVSHIGKEVQKVAEKVIESVTPRTKTDLEALTAMAKGISEFRDKVPREDYHNQELYEEVVRNYGMSKAREVYVSNGRKPAGQQYPTGPMDAMAKMKGFEYDNRYYDPRVNESLYAGGKTRAEQISEDMGDAVSRVDGIVGDSATEALGNGEIAADTVTVGYAGSNSYIETLAKELGPEATFGFQNSVTITGSQAAIQEISGILGETYSDTTLGSNITGSVVDEVLSGGVVVVSDDLNSESAVTTVAEELHHAAQTAVVNQTHQAILDHQRGINPLTDEELEHLQEVNAAAASFSSEDYTRGLPPEEYDRVNEIARTPSKTNPNGLPGRDENWNYVFAGTEVYAKAKVGPDFLASEIQAHTNLEADQAKEIAEMIANSASFNLNSTITSDYIQENQ